MTIYIQADFTTAQTGMGYQFFDAAGLLGSRVTDGITSPDTGVYVASALVPIGAIGVRWNADSGMVAHEDLAERLSASPLPGGGGGGGAGGSGYARFYGPLRAVLGDRDPFGNFAYTDDDLASGLDVLFLTGDVPDGYAAASGVITPEVAAGADFAVILYRAALLLLNGEDGAGSWRTRALSVADSGHRKRDLLTALRVKLSDFENGGDGIVFETQQNFFVWLGNLTASSPYEWYQRGPVPRATFPVPVLGTL